MNAHKALDYIAQHFTAEQWRELFARSKQWPNDCWSLLYPIYLRSKAWNAKRMARHAIDNFECQNCRRTTKNGVQIHCHHKTYDRIGDEDVADDLETLCELCHKVEHQTGSKPLREHLIIAMNAICDAIIKGAPPRRIQLDPITQNTNNHANH